MTDLLLPSRPPHRLPAQRTPAPPPPGKSRLHLVVRELVLLTALLLVYQASRLLGGRDPDAALTHGREILALEAELGLASEQRLQALLLDVGPVVQSANAYYAAAHLPVTALALLWLLLSRPGVYRRTRGALIGATAAALVVYLLVPVAPPRMLPGFVDTAAAHGQSVYGHSLLVNEYAALPSLHVGWAVLIALACMTAASSRWRWLWLTHPVLTVLVVVVTANHFWVDAIAGAALVSLAWLATSSRAPATRLGP